MLNFGQANEPRHPPGFGRSFVYLFTHDGLPRHRQRHRQAAHPCVRARRCGRRASGRRGARSPWPSCDTLGPWCEVVSGDTLFYIDETARYLFVGRLYDMEERRDVTAARLLELNPDLLAAGAARVASDAPAGRDETPVQAAANHVDLSSLPAAGAIHWGNLKGERLVVFSDFQCGYCQRLTAELAKAKVHVEERPISIFGAASRKISEAVLCAKDPAKALHAAYSGQALATDKTCKEAKALDANEAFAKANGFAGTPVIVRARDGAVLHGYRDAAAIRRFVAEGKGVAQ